MANYYVNYSEIIPKLNPEEKDWLKKELSVDTDKMSEEEEIAWKAERTTEVSDIVGRYWPEFEWGFQKDKERGMYLWVTDGVIANMDHVLNLFQRFLIRWRPEELLVIRWSESCDKPRVGAFGGGAFVLSATESTYINTGEWVQHTLKKWPEKKWIRPNEV